MDYNEEREDNFQQKELTSPSSAGLLLGTNSQKKINYDPNDIIKNSAIDREMLVGCELIGLGINPFLEYADPKSLKPAVLSFSNQQTKDFETNIQDAPTKKIPKSMTAISINTLITNTESATSIESFQEKISNRTTVDGKYGFFSASITASFSTESLVNNENSMSYSRQKKSLWSIILPNDDSSKKHLTEAASKAFKKISNSKESDKEANIKNLFDTFGSHFVSGVIMGGEASQSMLTNKKATATIKDMELTAKLALESATGSISVENELKYGSEIRSFISASQCERRLKGGNTDLISKVFPDDIEKKHNGLDEWMPSINKNPALIDYHKDNGLTGIWELAESDADKEKIKNYYLNTWAPEEAEKHEVHLDYITGITIIQGDSNIPPQKDYTRYPFDLNKGIHGSWVYICYSKTPWQAKPKRAVTGFKLTKNDEQLSSEYEKITVNLRSGKNGDAYYLWVKKEEYSSLTCINDIAISENNQHIPDYEKTGINLGIGSGSSRDTDKSYYLVTYNARKTG